MNFEQQIQHLFEQETLPVHVPGIDILIPLDEIIYSAKKPLPTEMIFNEAWDYDSVSKPQFIQSNLKYQVIEFVIREGLIYVIKASHE